jgi:hypothetical protein
VFQQGGFQSDSFQEGNLVSPGVVSYEPFQSNAFQQWMLSSGGQVVVAVPQGGHGSEGDDPLPGGIRWGSGQRQVTITGLIDPDDDDLEMLIYILAQLDD